MFGTDENLGPIAISVRREKLDPEERTNNLGRADYGMNQYRIICRTSEVKNTLYSLSFDLESGMILIFNNFPIYNLLLLL